MGIRGLLTYLMKSRKWEMMDLVAEAAKAPEGELEILVDFNALMRFLTELIVRQMQAHYENKFLATVPDEYELFTRAVRDFQSGMKQSGIRLVWFVDGPRGIDKTAGEHKRSTWIKRDNNDIARNDNMLSSCEYMLPTSDLNNHGPIICLEVILDALREAGAEVVQLLQGGADEFVALEFHRRRSFAVLTNDTDYVVFPGVRVIFDRMLGMAYGAGSDDVWDAALRLPFVDPEGLGGKLIMAPTELKVPVVSSRLVQSLLEFSHEDQLVVLSVFSGSDNVENYAGELHHTLGLSRFPDRPAHISRIAQYIVREKLMIDNIATHGKLRDFIRQRPYFLETIQFCKEMFQLTRVQRSADEGLIILRKDEVEFLSSEVASDEALETWVRRQVATSRICRPFHSIFHGAIYFSVYVERPTESCARIHEALMPLRQAVYERVVHSSHAEVKEWTPRTKDVVVRVPVKPAAIRANQIHGYHDPSNGDTACPDHERCGFRIFKQMLNFDDSEKRTDLYDQFGVKLGFLCDLLRYFRHVAVDRNLQVTETEFRALFVTVMYQFSSVNKPQVFEKCSPSKSSFLQMNICPSARLVIIINWFMVLVYQVRYMCGAVCSISEVLPDPQELMSAAVMAAFYCRWNQEERIAHLDENLLSFIDRLGQAILKEYDEQFQFLTGQSA